MFGRAHFERSKGDFRGAIVLVFWGASESTRENILVGQLARCVRHARGRGRAPL